MVHQDGSDSLLHTMESLFWRYGGVVLAVCAAVFLLLGFGQDGINLDSATYSVIARNMTEQGNWLAPHYTTYYFPQFAEHPPLVLWLQGLVFLILPPNDATARIIGALSVFFSVLLVYGIGRNVHSRRAGVLSGMVLLLTYNYLQIGNSTMLDVPMTMFSLLALYGLARMTRSGLAKDSVVMLGLGLGGAWLSKGVVSAPIWIAVTLYVLIWRRSWLRTARFWIGPLIALVMVGGHLLLDHFLAGGYFFRRYFFHQIGGRFLENGPEIHTDWWEFSWRFVKLYLPMVVLMPVGTYLVAKKRLVGYYPLLIASLFYFVFYSSAAKLYYHYFCPVYALAAPIVGVPPAVWLTEQGVRRLLPAFSILWLLVAIGITIGGVRIHHVRHPELYALNEPMRSYLDKQSIRNGVMVGAGEPDWGFVAKTAWYWRSDISHVSDVEQAERGLRAGQYAYLMIDKSRVERDALLHQFKDVALSVLYENERLVIAIPTPKFNTDMREVLDYSVSELTDTHKRYLDRSSNPQAL